MRKQERLLLLRMNKRLERWKKAGVESFIISEVKNSLLNFYLKHDLKAPPTARFTVRKGMTREQELELINLAKAMENVKQSNVGYYKKLANKYDVSEATRKSYETAKRNYPASFGSFVEWVKWTDMMQQTNQFTEYYDSKTLADIYDYGYSLGLTSKQIQSNMKKQLRYGKNTPFESRYDATVARINKYYDKLQEDINNEG